MQVDSVGLSALADSLMESGRTLESADPAQHRLTGDADTLAFVLCLDAINFGSGWFPELRKRPGLSGYFSLAGALRDHFERGEVLDAETLCCITGEECARILEQDFSKAPVAELMNLFARAWRDLGQLVGAQFGSSFEALVESAEQSAEALVLILARMPLYRDVESYGERLVPFYKRAQLSCADLALAFGGEGLGRFHDLDRLTMFADNLVPHVLRVEGVLVYEPDLLARIEAGELIPLGSAEEVEIRAAAVHAVECLGVEILPRHGFVPAREIDQLLWSRGQSPSIKAHPRHRTRCTFY